ncbi:hypothetical protein JHK84_047909 [Glycine max]|nr:hypothetical protein JHK84_047909 [Glycine max]
MLKEGHKHLFGLHEVVLKNIDAYKQTIQILDELVEDGFENMDVRDKEQVISRMKAVVANKQFGQEDIICSLVADLTLVRTTLDQFYGKVTYNGYVINEFVLQRIATCVNQNVFIWRMTLRETLAF